MRAIEDFSAEDRLKASQRLRLVKPENALKIAFKDHYWSVAFLLRLIERVDETIYVDPREARAYAEGMPRLAERIPIQSAPDRLDSAYYQDQREATGFRAWAHSVLSSTECASGHFEDARWHAKKALDLARHAPELARGEVLRRAALLELNLDHLDLAQPMAEESIDIFAEIEDLERLALSHICRGNILLERGGPDAGVTDYATALHRIAGVRSKRAERVVVIAATNLASAAAHSSMKDLERAFKYTSAAITAMNRRRVPMNIPKLTVRWTEAVLAARFGYSNYAVKWLAKVRDGFLDFGALVQAVRCVVDLLSVVKDFHPETLHAVATDSLERVMGAAQGSTPSATTLSVIRTWAKRPTDVESLRHLAKRDLRTERRRT